MNLASLDLNLLLVYRALLIHRSVTRAGQELGLSQPAISHALGRLRDYYKDPLFLRTRDGMQPTPRARELAGPVQEALSRIELTSPGLKTLDPASIKRTFRIGQVNYSGLALISSVVASLEREAPDLELDTAHMDEESCLSKLQDADLDAAIGVFSHVPPGWPTRELLTDRLVVAMRRKHPRISQPPTLETYANERHIRVSSADVIDECLAKRGLRRRFAVSANMPMVPFILARSNLLAVVPSGLVRRFQRICDLKWLDVPVHLPGYRVLLVHHPRSEGDRQLEWLAGTVQSMARKVREEVSRTSAFGATGRPKSASRRKH